jgi:hypothetical protein
MTAQHTPGPWYACYSKTDEFPGGNIRSDHHVDGTGALLLQAGPVFHDYKSNREEERANLELAAAAPALKALVMGFLGTLDTDNDEALVRAYYNQNIELFNAAIDVIQSLGETAPDATGNG